MLSPTIALIAYRPEYAFALVTMWRRSFQQALALPNHHPLAEVLQQMDGHLGNANPQHITLAMDTENSTIAGFMEQDKDMLINLYIHTDYQGQGLGRHLLNRAKQTCSGTLSLYTFELNKKAQRFYEKHGFRVVQRGSADPEYNPWASDPAQLRDILYRWQKSSE